MMKKTMMAIAVAAGLMTTAAPVEAYSGQTLRDICKGSSKHENIVCDAFIHGVVSGYAIHGDDADDGPDVCLSQHVITPKISSFWLRDVARAYVEDVNNSPAGHGSDMVIAGLAKRFPCETGDISLPPHEVGYLEVKEKQ